MRSVTKKIERMIKIHDDCGSNYSVILTGIIYSDEKTILSVRVSEKDFLSKEDTDFFNCLIDLRNNFQAMNFKILCNGCRKNVSPTGMQRQMTKGLKAHLLVIGEPLSHESVVNIFDECDISQVCSPQEQQQFYEQWYNS
jgi:hypothetical protein